MALLKDPQEELRRQLSESALTGNTAPVLSGGNLALPGISAQGPGASATGVLEGFVSDQLSIQAQKKSALEASAPTSLAGNPATDGPIQEAQTGIGPSQQKFGDLTRREKLNTVLNILGQALAVASSNDPGAALASQIAGIQQQRELVNARQLRAEERRADRDFGREQFASETQTRAAAQDRSIQAQALERARTREFDLQRDLEKFVRETGFQEEKIARAQKFQSETRQGIRAEELAERRQSQIQDLTIRLAPKLATLGETENGNIDPLSRARRVATAFLDGTTKNLGDADKASLEFVLRKDGATTPADQRSALIEAASRLVGKMQPVPDTELSIMPNGEPELDEQGNEVHRLKVDPVTGKPVPKMDPLGQIVKVPMTFDEAMSFVALGMEENEFFTTRTADPGAIKVAEQAGAVVVDPSKIEPQHLLDSGGRLGLISVIGQGAGTGEELLERMDLFEESMIGRGFSGFTEEVKKQLKAAAVKKDRDFESTSRMLDKQAKLSGLSRQPGLR